MGTIGNILVLLEANSASFEKPVDKAGKSLDQLKEKAGGFDLGKMLAAGAGVGIAVEGIHMAVEGVEKLAELGKKAIELVAETVQDATRAYRLAGSLNIPTDSLMAFQNAAKAAGVDSDTFDAALRKLQLNLGKGADDGGKAAAGLAALGLNAKQLEGQGLDKSLEQIANGLAGIQDGSRRAEIEVELLGKSGQNLDALFRQGAEGLEKAKEEGRLFGNTFNDLESAKLVAVNNEFVKIGERIEGVKDRLVLALAPAFLAIANQIEGLIPSATTMSSAFATGLHYVGDGIGVVLDGFHALHIAVDVIKVVGQATVVVLLEALAKLGHGVEFLLNKFLHMHVAFAGELDQIASLADSVASDSIQGLKDDWNAPWPHQGVDAAFAKINADADKAAADLNANHKDFAAPIDDSFGKAADDIEKRLAELKKRIDEFGMDEGQKELFEIKAAGGSAEAIAQAQKYVDTLKQLENAKKAGDAIKDLNKEIAEFGMSAADKKLDALNGIADPEQMAKLKELSAHMDALEEHKKVFEETATPLEKYSAAMDELNKKLADGRIFQADYAKEAAHLRDELEKQNKAKDHKPEHEKVAAAMIRRFDFRLLPVGKKDGHKDHAAATKQIAASTKQAAGHLKKVESNSSEQLRLQRQAMENAGDVASIA